MSSASNTVSERAGTANIKPYDDVVAGTEFASEFETVSGSVPKPTNNNNLTDRPGQYVPAAQSAIERFGDNEVAKALYGANDNSTEKGERPGPISVSSVEGVYAKSRFVPTVRRGKKIVDADTSLFPFNYVAGRRSENTISVGRDDRMSPAEAKAKLLGILTMFGVESEAHEYLYTFTHALLVTHALNGASMIGPGRATFYVNTDAFQYGDVVKYLNQDSRRFYRAFADETAKALLSVLDKYDPGDSNTVRICGQIRSIAVNRKLTQFPYLIHDSADACYRTSVTEMAAVAKSKQHVLNNGGSLNAIDELEKSIDA